MTNPLIIIAISFVVTIFAWGIISRILDGKGVGPFEY